jgi:hypothetical protein
LHGATETIGTSGTQETSFALTHAEEKAGWKLASRHLVRFGERDAIAL